jgi:outer membrane protein assembly factor BamB
MTRAELQRDLLDKIPGGAVTDWRLSGGNAARNAQAAGGPPHLTPVWKVSLTRTEDTRVRLETATTALAQRDQPILPSASPVAAFAGIRGTELAPLIVYRSHYGVHALDVRTGKVRWETPSNWSMDRMFRDNRNTGAVNAWTADHLRSRPNFLLENSTVGTYSTDGAYLYLVDDFEVPPALTKQIGDGDGRVQMGSGELADAVRSNHLQAFDLAAGKLRWELGGKLKKDDFKRDKAAESYFLGAPLPADGKLYAVIEKEHRPVPDAALLAAPGLAAHDGLRDTRQICIAVLDPRDGDPQSIKPLFTHRRPMLDGLRRGLAVHLAEGYGVVVCCAHTGTVAGYNTSANRLLWSVTYRDPADGESREETPGWLKAGDDRFVDPEQFSRWKATPPVIADGKVVFAAADAPAVYCLDLRSGEQLWSVPRVAGDLYLAGVVRGKVLIVGDGRARAVNLEDGEKAWETPTGQPSGFGAFAGGRYYLPLRFAGPKKESEICVLDVRTGAAVAHVRPRNNKEVPGNLVYFNGHVLSQTATELVAYPQPEPFLNRIDEALEKDPNNVQGLYERALLREGKGELVGAVEDLRTALRNNPPPALREAMRDKLFEMLTQLLRTESDKADKYLKEYEELRAVKVSADVVGAERQKARQEEDRRRITFLIVAATAHEKQGKLAEAMKFYLDLALTETNELVPLPDDPELKISLDRWALGRIEQMLKKATPEQRQQLEEALWERWKKSKS